MRRDERGPWYLLTGLVLGAALGLFYAWWIRPVTYTNTSPASLRAEFKDQYCALIASPTWPAETWCGPKPGAAAQRSRVYRSLAEQAQRTLADGSSVQEARALGVLAVSLGRRHPIPSQSQTRRLSRLSPGSTITPAGQDIPITVTISATAVMTGS
jgi:hypothetical protein